MKILSGSKKTKTAVFISGKGSNLKTIAPNAAIAIAPEAKLKN